VEAALSSDLRDRITKGEDVQVDPSAIERSLAELWKVEKSDPHAQGVTRAALWNVVAHTCRADLHDKASETLARAAAVVPQRTIIIRVDTKAQPQLASWISANCHVEPDGRQICSEEISIIASGDRIHRVPPLVNALLIPDMPVAVWWIGDLPDERGSYVLSLLDAADRLIVDSIFFDNPNDLALIQRVAEKSTTSPADLNWVRLEEWRAATASLFDTPQMRQRLGMIRAVRVVASVEDPSFFGQLVESVFYSSWLTTQAGQVVDEDGKVEGAAGSIEYAFKFDRVPDIHGILQVEIEFTGGSVARISRDPQRDILLANVDGVTHTPESVTRTQGRGSDNLIVRQLKRPEADQIFLRVLPVSIRLARRIAG
jgi:glucose-6-phosphate dehydrogenase assembly protein OpcA